MLATSTHDNKRSEDVRARIDVLSEMPAAWRLLLRRWSRMNREQEAPARGRARAVARATSTCSTRRCSARFPAAARRRRRSPAYRERIERYMLKAAREAKVHTSWVNLNDEYERRVRGFVEGLLGRAEGNRFLDDLREQAGRDRVVRAPQQRCR